MKEWGIQLVSFYDWLVSSAVAHRAGCAAVRRGLRAADCLGERREPVARTRGVAGEGNGGSHRAWRGRGRLLRQLLVESLTLSAIGGAAGLLAAVWAVEAIDAALPPNLLPVSRRRDRHDRPGVRDRADGCHRSPLWHRSGVARREARFERRAETGDARFRRGRPATAS